MPWNAYTPAMDSALQDLLVNGLTRDVLDSLYEQGPGQLEQLAAGLAANRYTVLSALEDLELLKLARVERVERAGRLVGRRWVVERGAAARLLGVGPVASPGPRSRPSGLGT